MPDRDLWLHIFLCGPIHSCSTTFEIKKVHFKLVFYSFSFSIYSFHIPQIWRSECPMNLLLSIFSTQHLFNLVQTCLQSIFSDCKYNPEPARNFTTKLWAWHNVDLRMVLLWFFMNLSFLPLHRPSAGQTVSSPLPHH